MNEVDEMNNINIKGYWKRTTRILRDVKDFWDWFIDDHIDISKPNQYSQMPRKAYIIIEDNIEKKTASDVKRPR